MGKNGSEWVNEGGQNKVYMCGDTNRPLNIDPDDWPRCDAPMEEIKQALAVWESLPDEMRAALRRRFGHLRRSEAAADDPLWWRIRELAEITAEHGIGAAIVNFQEYRDSGRWPDSIEAAGDCTVWQVGITHNGERVMGYGVTLPDAMRDAEVAVEERLRWPTAITTEETPAGAVAEP